MVLPACTLFFWSVWLDRADPSQHSSSWDDPGILHPPTPILARNMPGWGLGIWSKPGQREDFVGLLLQPWMLFSGEFAKWVDQSCWWLSSSLLRATGLGTQRASLSSVSGKCLSTWIWSCMIMHLLLAFLLMKINKPSLFYLSHVFTFCNLQLEVS